MPVKSNETVKSKFGAQTLIALRHTGEICGSNGLPLTPKSIAILGKSQFLKSLKHKNLAKYLDFIRGKHERLLIVCEYHSENLRSRVGGDSKKVAYQMSCGLRYLASRGIVHRSLSPDNVLLDDDGNVKLFNYALYYITNGGKDVAFPIGSVKYTAPEVLLSITNPEYVSGPKVDVWSLGIILAELVFQKPLWPNLKLGPCLRKVLSLIYCDDVFSRLARETDCLKVYEDMDPDFRNFITMCLSVNPMDRPTADELLTHKLFENTNEDPVTEFSDLEEINFSGHPLNSLKLDELYYLWRLAGGDVQSELKRHGLIRSKAPILTMPNLIFLEGMTFGHVKDEAAMLDLKVVPLPLDLLVQRLKHIPVNNYFPLLITKLHSDLDFDEMNLKSSENLPLIIRERDTEHQFHRIILFKRLLQGYPNTNSTLCDEAKNDIPPYFRGDIWTALLNVKGNIDGQYTAIDKETPISTDRQIEVDIPRCHQYNELLSSKSGHLKLKRVLKAWVINNPQYVYWQGLDSLCAPFLYLNFNNEARAYACFSAFIPKYLQNFFLKDNSSVIKEYLTKFSHLIVFHDPVLANHLHDINFVPELFAIPWFLTMFSHVFPLHKIFHLWDRLLLGDSSYPLFVGLAILQQLRDTLLSSGFNECILLFSDLPEIDIEKCVIDSSTMHSSTPFSLSYRRYQMSDTKNSVFVSWNNFFLRNSEVKRIQIIRIYCGDISELKMSLEEVTDEWLPEIQKEYNPRLSEADFLQLFRSKDKRSNLLTVDGRSSDEYMEEAVPSSINIPFDTVDFEKETSCEGVPPGPELSILINNKGKLIAVITSTTHKSAKLSRFLSRAEFPKVCFLHGGIQVLRSAGILAPTFT